MSVKEATKSKPRKEVKILTINCKKHGDYTIAEPRHKKGYICPECHKEVLARPVSNPICIPSLGVNNKFVIVNKGSFVSGMMMAHRIHGKKISTYTRWSKPSSINNPIIDDPSAEVYICQIHPIGSVIKPKVNGMKRPMVICDKRTNIKPNMFYTQTDMWMIDDVFKDTKKAHSCEVISDRVKWEVVPEHWVGKPCSEFVGVFANPML